LEKRQSGILDDLKGTKSAVMLPLVEHEGKLSVLFEVRSYQLKGQPGEICFPGGHMEAQDATPLAAAVRETVEELGLSPKDITVLGDLDVLVTPFRVMLYPYVGYIKDGTVLMPQQDEVAEVFFVPLDYLCQAEPTVSYTNVSMAPAPDFPTHLLPNGKDYNWRGGNYPVYFYTYENYIIWGLTARILHHFLEVINCKDSNG